MRVQLIIGIAFALVLEAVLPAQPAPSPIDAFRQRYANKAFAAKTTGSVLDENGKPVPAYPEWPGRILSDPPNRVRIDEGEYHFIANESKAILVLTPQAVYLNFDLGDARGAEALIKKDPTLGFLLAKYPVLTLPAEMSIEGEATILGTRAVVLRSGDPVSLRVMVEPATGRALRMEQLVDEEKRYWMRIDLADENPTPAFDAKEFDTTPPEGLMDVTADNSPRFSGLEAKALEGQSAPLFALKSLEGTEVSLASARGKTVLIDFWASWCKLCLEEMPALQALSERLDPAKAAVWGVNIDNLTDQEKTTREIATQLKITYPQLIGNEQVAEDYKISPLPMLVLVGPDGIIRRVFVTHVPEIDELQKAIDAAGTTPPPAAGSAPAGS